MIYAQLFFEFFKTGLFAIGGGLATLPFLSNIADKYVWFTHEQLADMIAISESTPGPIGINMATYAGFLTAGVPGSLIATLALVLPSFIVILIIARFLKSFGDSRIVQAAFYGLRAASVGLIIASAFSVFKLVFIPDNQFSLVNTALAALIGFLCFKFEKIHPIALILASAIIGIIFNLGGV